MSVQSAVDHADVAMATAAFLTITQLGGAVGSALSGAIWNSLLPRALRQSLPESELIHIADIVGSLSVALSYAPGSAARVAIDGAYAHAQYVLNIVALLALMPTLWAVFAMRDTILHDGAIAVSLARRSFVGTLDFAICP